MFVLGTDVKIVVAEVAQSSTMIPEVTCSGGGVSGL